MWFLELFAICHMFPYFIEQNKNIFRINYYVTYFMKVMLFQSLYTINFHFRYILYVQFLKHLHTQVTIRKFTILL